MSVNIKGLTAAITDSGVLRNNLYPFQISFPKIIKVAADELESEVITNGKKKFQDKTKRKK